MINARVVHEIVTYVPVDYLNLRVLRGEFRRGTRDALNSVLSLLGGLKQGDKCKSDAVSRTRTVQAVIDSTEAS
jgi:hypothetical protein